jgi:hypothetical protein
MSSYAAIRKCQEARDAFVQLHPNHVFANGVCICSSDHGICDRIWEWPADPRYVVCETHGKVCLLFFLGCEAFFWVGSARIFCGFFYAKCLHIIVSDYFSSICPSPTHAVKVSRVYNRLYARHWGRDMRSHALSAVVRPQGCPDNDCANTV